MKKAIVAGIGAGVVGALFWFPGCGGSSCEDTKTCAPDGGDSGTSDVVTEPPPGCDLTKDPKDSPACLDDSIGVFVDGKNGKDSNAGTKSAPVQTISHALSIVGNKSRIYVCAGTYAEHVHVTGAVSLYGAFKCSDWLYDATAAVTVAPTDPGFGLEVDSVAAPIIVADVEFDAKAGTAPGDSSVAGFVNGSSDVSFVRDKLVAANGVAAGAAGTLPANTKVGTAGNGATTGAGGSMQSCSCVDTTTSVGAAGGDAGLPDAQAGKGGMANPTAPVETAKPFDDGSGGAGAVQAQSGCGQGHPGANAPTAGSGSGAVKVGELDAVGWVSQPGGDGKIGAPGQGGGGGGGGAAIGGGGGACGGCGGAGGKGGAGGGASVALLVLQSNVKLVSTTLVAANAGDGGAGGTGEAGGGGGGGGGSLGACSGGDGGNGSGGGGGGGGAGGVSAGIVWKGTIPPTVDGTPQTTAMTLTTVTLGNAGAAGSKGSGGGSASTNGNVGNPGQDGTPGIPGVAQAILQAP